MTGRRVHRAGRSALRASRAFVLFGALALGSAAPPALAADANGLPFELTWTHGTCGGCNTAQTIVNVEFVGPDEAWGIGYTPPGETGLGDYVILHTKDGARTWTELGASYEHNDSPSVSFSNQYEGWVMIADIATAEQRLLETRDGGAHWRRLPLRDWLVRGIQYLGSGVGYAYSFDNYKQQGSLFATRDYGRHWSSSALPPGFSPERMTFVSARQGLLAGCLGHQVVVARTSDAGRHWNTTPIELPPIEAPFSGYCDYFADDLSAPDARHAWLLVRKRMFKLGDKRAIDVVSRTSDGGATWTMALQEAYLVGQKDFTAVQFLSEHLGFVSTVEGLDGPERKAALRYTTDGGETWLTADVPHAIAGCRPYSGVLMCAASDFWVLKIGQLATGM